MSTPYVAIVFISAIACVTDVRSRRIPNLLTFGSAVLGVLYHAAANGVPGAGHAVAGWVVGVALFFLPFALGGMGAGDIKLLGALGAWLGPREAVWLALYTGVAGGVVALAVALMRGYLRQLLSNLQVLFAHWQTFGLKPVQEITLEGSNSPKLAYAVPILIGTLATIWLR